MDFLTGSEINDDIKKQLASIPSQAPAAQPVMAPPPPPQQYYAPQPMMMPPQYNMPPVGYPQQPGGYPYGQQMPSHQHQMYGAPQGTSSQMVPQHYGASQQQQQQQQQQQK